MPAILLQPILNAALADYTKQIGIDLSKHHLADSLRLCRSPDDVLKLLEDKANQFKDFRDGKRKLFNWLSPVVHVVHTLSAALGTSITLVSRKFSFFARTFFHQFCYQVPFEPAKAIFAGVDVLIAVRIPLHSSNYIASSYLDPTGSQWRQLELRCARRFVRMPWKFPQTPSNLHRSPLDSFHGGDNCKDNGRVTLRACSRYQTD